MILSTLFLIKQDPHGAGRRGAAGTTHPPTKGVNGGNTRLAMVG